MSAPDHFYSGLGSSVVPAIMGMDRFKTKYRLWEEFTDPAMRPDLSENEAVEAGIELEDGIAKWAAKKWDFKIEHRPARVVHPIVPCMQAHIDRFVVGERAVLEVKNRGLAQAKFYDAEESEDAPDDLDRIQPSEALQVQSQLAVTGHQTAYVAVLIGGQKLLRFKVLRDEAIIAKIEAACTEFWRHVTERIPPDPTNADDARRRWPEHSPGKFIDATPELERLVAERRELKALLKDSEVALDVCELQIKRAMQEAEEIRKGGTRLIGWKTQARAYFEQTRFKEDHPVTAGLYTEERRIRVLR